MQAFDRSKLSSCRSHLDRLNHDPPPLHWRARVVRDETNTARQLIRQRARARSKWHAVAFRADVPGVPFDAKNSGIGRTDSGGLDRLLHGTQITEFALPQTRANRHIRHDNCLKQPYADEACAGRLSYIGKTKTRPARLPSLEVHARIATRLWLSHATAKVIT